MKTGSFRFISYAFVFPIILISSANAATITFDDIDASSSDVPLGSYQGYTWNNILAYTTLEGFPGFNNGIVSPLNAAYSGGELAGAPFIPIVGSLSAANPFDFASAQLGAGYYDNLQLLVQGSLNGSIMYSQTVTVNTSGAALFTFGFNNIDLLSFTAIPGAASTDPYQCGNFNCTQFTLDDLTVTATGTSSPIEVPEPGPLALIGIGIAAVLARRYRAFTSV